MYQKKETAQSATTGLLSKNNSDETTSSENDVKQITISVVENATSVETHNKSVDEVLRAIREGGRGGKIKGLITQIRNNYAYEAEVVGDKKKAKEKASELKRSLPAVLWSGTFAKRANDALIQHSGLLCADLDDLGDSLEDVHAALRRSPHLWALLTSPSGTGLKAVFRVPPDASIHLASFRAIEKHVQELAGAQIDESCKDPARLCFMSYDPDLYHNPDAAELEPLPEPEKPKHVSNGELPPDLPLRERIASGLLGPIEWDSQKGGYFCKCPGEASHTNETGNKHTILYLDGAATIKCQHNACLSVVETYSYRLRSEIGKAEYKPGKLKEYNTCAGMPLDARKTSLDSSGDVASPIQHPGAPTPAQTPPGPKTPVNTPGEAEATKAKPMCVMSRPLGELLGAICGYLRRYVVFQFPEQPEAIALWTVHTWLFNAFDYTVYLFIYSASMRSGKTRVLEVLELLCCNPEMTPGASAAALIRSGDEENPPTLLLDEMDTVYSKRNDTEADNTRRFLNAGYKRGAKFMKCVGQGADISVKKFPAFCPKALAGIDRCLPDTVLDRSLPIELVRQSHQEKAERLRDREAKAITAPLRAELEALAQQPGVIESLRSARPVMPSELHDRAQDISEPLAAIADLAGGEWPEKGRAALIRLFSGQEEETDINVKLLADIRRVFDDKGADKLPTKELLDALVAVEDGAPWAQWWSDALNHDKVQIAASSLARKLKRYKIKPRTIKIDGHEESAKGYHRADFESVWKRYLSVPPQQAVTAVTAVTIEGKKVTATAPVTANCNNKPEKTADAESEISRHVTANDEQAVTGIYLGKKAKSYEVTAGDGFLKQGANNKPPRLSVTMPNTANSGEAA
jgi:Protein of unknown function (DUF3631)/VirE N-terminal domain